MKPHAEGVRALLDLHSQTSHEVFIHLDVESVEAVSNVLQKLAVDLDLFLIGLRPLGLPPFQLLLYAVLVYDFRFIEWDEWL